MTDLPPRVVIRDIPPGPQLFIEEKMDTITLAILAAATAGLLAGVTEVSKKFMVDVYNLLKKLLKKEDIDPEVLKAAQDLLAQIKAQPGGEQHIQDIRTLIEGEDSPFSLENLTRNQP